MDSILAKVNGIASQIQLAPVTKTLERGFGQVKQFAQERLGTAEDVTDLPTEYKELERKVDALRTLHSTFLKLHSNDTILPAALQDTFNDIGKAVKDVAAGATGVGAAMTAEQQQEQRQLTEQSAAKKTAAHALAGASFMTAEQFGEADPLGNALQKIGASQERIGDARYKMDTDMNTKFTIPFQATLNGDLTHVMLDAVKSRFKNAPPHRVEQMRVELEQAEDVFVQAVDEATVIMKRCVESPEPLRNLADLIAVQLTYYKECAKVLEDLAPEIDEIQVTQESMYRNQLS
ncbi:BAR domain-containing protein [Sorochytrium milnesiophthora]